MKWRKITINTTTEAVDVLCYRLTEIGIEGIEIIDNIPLTEDELNQMFVDIPLIEGEDDGKAKINCYIEFSENLEDIISKINLALEETSEFVNIGQGTIDLSETEDKDWINNWKEFFKPFRIDDNIIIKPSWEELKEQYTDDIVIEIDPGIAFGTGSHETTKLCITSLKEYIKQEDKILDIGSGSGILSIIANKLGAKEVRGIDIDENATKEALRNVKLNNLNIDKSSLYFETANILVDNDYRDGLCKEYYNIIVANILADVIMPLSKIIGPYLKPDGLFISSGIINTKEDIVRETLINNNFEIIKINKMGDWVSFVAKNKI